MTSLQDASPRINLLASAQRSIDLNQKRASGSFVSNGTSSVCFSTPLFHHSRAAAVIAPKEAAADLFGLHTPPAKPHPTYRRLSRYDCTGLILAARRGAAVGGLSPFQRG